jgi:hypothetical protein
LVKKNKNGVLARPQPDPALREEGTARSDFGFADEPAANSVAGISVGRRTILLLLGEKAGMREDVKRF